MESMRNAGVQTSIHYPPIHQFTYYRQRYPELSLPVTEEVAAREVTLPLYPGLRDDEVDWVLSATIEALSFDRMFASSG
ncbi:MAG: aminotransferase DegT [Chloroflexi bacterium]|nr:aminotransferase DegT [Chloroflexota bacterium]